jgi:3-oxoadipate enol-lactonase
MVVEGCSLFRAISYGHDLAEQPPVVMKQVRAMSRYDASARLKELGHIPTLVISASGDRIALPRYGRELAGLIPSARYVEIADAGHGVTIQRAREINDLLEAHWLAATTREASASPATVSEATRRTPSR